MYGLYKVVSNIPGDITAVGQDRRQIRDFSITLVCANSSQLCPNLTCIIAAEYISNPLPAFSPFFSPYFPSPLYFHLHPKMYLSSPSLPLPAFSPSPLLLLSANQARGLREFVKCQPLLKQGLNCYLIPQRITTVLNSDDFIWVLPAIGLSISRMYCHLAATDTNEQSGQFWQLSRICCGLLHALFGLTGSELYGDGSDTRQTYSV